MTNPLLDKLADMDAEVEDTLERLSGDEDMYLTYLRQLPQNENIASLRRAVAEKNSTLAEREVHTLKGVALNLGLLPLVDVCMDMLLELRAGNAAEAYEMLPNVECEFEKWASAIAEG